MDFKVCHGTLLNFNSNSSTLKKIRRKVFNGYTSGYSTIFFLKLIVNN